MFGVSTPCMTSVHEKVLLADKEHAKTRQAWLSLTLLPSPVTAPKQPHPARRHPPLWHTQSMNRNHHTDTQSLCQLESCTGTEITMIWRQANFYSHWVGTKGIRMGWESWTERICVLVYGFTHFWWSLFVISSRQTWRIKHSRKKTLPTTINNAIA